MLALGLVVALLALGLVAAAASLRDAHTGKPSVATVIVVVDVDEQLISLGSDCVLCSFLLIVCKSLNITPISGI